MTTMTTTQVVSGLSAWWDNRSSLERWLLGVLGCAALCAGSGAIVYAIATGGMVLASGGTVVAVGKAATIMAAA